MSSSSSETQTQVNIRALARIQVVKRRHSFIRPFIIQPSFNSVGTGFIVAFHPDVKHRSKVVLTLVTAAHVVASAEKVTLRFPGIGKEEFPAEVWRTSDQFDVAIVVCRIDKTLCRRARLTKLAVASVKDVKDMKQGSRVEAYGYPTALDHAKASAGVYNGLEEHALMHDAATSPGSSGGPLVAMDINKVIGVVSWKKVDAAVEGVQFTMPIFLVQALLQHKGSDRSVQRAVFGFCIQTSDELTLGETKGCRVFQVLPESPAAKAGLKKGDVITHFDGMAFNSFEETKEGRWTTQPMSLSEVMFFSFARRPYELIVVRKDTTRTEKLNITPVDARKSMFSYNQPFTSPPSFAVVDGLCLMTTSQNMMETRLAGVLQCKTSKQLFDCTWVIVTNVMNGSRAAHVDSIAAGDIINTVNGKKVSKVEDVIDMLGSKRLALETEDGIQFTTTAEKVVEWAKMMASQRLRTTYDVRHDDSILQ